MTKKVSLETKVDSILEMLEQMKTNVSFQNDGYVNIETVKKFTGLSTQSIYNNIRTGTFPRPHKFGRNSRWLLSEIVEHGRVNRTLARPNNQPTLAS